MLTSLTRIGLVILLLASCGKGSSNKNAKKDAGLTAPVATPIALPTLGVDKIAKFNFIYDGAAVAYFKSAKDALKKSDWAEVRKQCEAALSKNPDHLDAHRLLAIALAQQGEHAAAVDHLVAAIAGDYYGYGPTVADEAQLKDFLATQHGQAVTQLAAQIHDEYTKRIKSSLWLVARRSPFRWPDKPGAQPGTSRGELYAFDRESKRYFRLTHTDHQVAGFVRSKGAEVAVLGYDKIDHPKDDAPSQVARAWVQAYDTTEWKSATPKITLPSARVVAVWYGEGDQLLVGTAPSTGRWTLGEWTISSVDKTTGKLTKVGASLGAPRIELTLDEGRVVLPANPEGVTATWAGDPPRASELDVGGTKIAVPESGQANHDTIALSPGGASLAFATAVDPCAKDTAPSLYIANAKTGALKHVLTAKSRFITAWLDPATLAYEDGDGAIRLWDATSGREAMKLENKAGLALDVLSLAPAPLCKQEPPTAEQAGSGGDEMPPEETGSGGPVTQPQ
ncbi:MAG TPA: hypothetical protein VMZ53_27920 [Kofleriaceae bacterium]|nr:hypothetical protein [Kofleriaceae bacterium]